MITFEKITPTCSNVYLIDQRYCLKDSLDIINYNFLTLSESISSLYIQQNNWYDIYTLVSQYSARWLTTASNVKQFSAAWIDLSTTVSKLSSSWNKHIQLYYPQMIDFTVWYSKTSIQQISLIKNWLDVNFNPIYYTDDQMVNVLIYLNQETSFSFKFNRSLYEPCIPNGGGGSLSCSGCPKPSRGCNHHGGLAGYGPCTNAYDKCTIINSSATSVPVACQGGGSKQLSIGLKRDVIEKTTCRTINMKFKNINNVWINI
jgi:hypothetical protein